MFELLPDNGTLPVPESAIIQVNSGMNKLRVSVGEYVSEPSEVYIITSEDEALLRSYILFYVVEPSTRVIYGYAGNPYDPVFKEEVLQEAVDFVEEMGAILEEVPWSDMSPEERQNWIRNESFYPVDEVDGVEEILDLEEIEPEELQEIIEVGEPLEEDEDTQAEAPETEELIEEESAEIEPEESAEVEEAEVEETGEEVEEIEAEGTVEEMEEESDFDSLLKQAFLKPELVEKRKMRKTSEQADDLEDEEPSEDEAGAIQDEEILDTDDEPMEAKGEPSDDEDGPEEEKPPSTQPEDEDVESDIAVSEEELAMAEDDDLSALIQEISAQTYGEEALPESAEEELTSAEDSEDQTRMTVIRYLSRF